MTNCIRHLPTLTALSSSVAIGDSFGTFSILTIQFNAIAQWNKHVKALSLAASMVTHVATLANGNVLEKALVVSRYLFLPFVQDQDRSVLIEGNVLGLSELFLNECKAAYFSVTGLIQ